MSKVSKYILRRIHVIGITAKRTDAIRATFLLYRLSDILYIKKVSTTARMPIITLGTKWSISIDWTSGVGCNEFGYPTLLIIQLKTIVQSMGGRKFVDIHYWQIPGARNRPVPTLPSAYNVLRQYVLKENLMDSRDG